MSCGFFDIGCHVGASIDSWFASIVTNAVNPVFGLLGRTLLSTPDIGGIGTVRSLWTASAGIADGCYILLVLAGGFLVMSHNTLQTSYAVKEIAPRLVAGMVASNLSLLVFGKAISLANGLSAAVAGQGLDPYAAGQLLRNLVYRIVAEGDIFFILLAVFCVILVVVLTVIFVARLMLTAILLVIAPLALAFHALPQTESIARWWWRAMTGLLAVQVAQSLVLVLTARLFFSSGWLALMAGDGIDPLAAVVLDACELIVVLYIMIRIPFWISRRVWPQLGPSPARTAVRFAFYAAVLSRIRPVLAGRGSLPRLPGGPRP